MAEKFMNKMAQMYKKKLIQWSLLMKYVCAGFNKIHFTAYVIICCDLLDSHNCGIERRTAVRLKS